MLQIIVKVHRLALALAIDRVLVESDQISSDASIRHLAKVIARLDTRPDTHGIADYTSRFAHDWRVLPAQEQGHCSSLEWVQPASHLGWLELARIEAEGMIGSG